jgi:hypothetical protein
MLALCMGTIRARRWIDANTLGSFREPPAAKPQSCQLGKRLPSSLGQLLRAEQLQTYRVIFSPFKRPGFSGVLVLVLESWHAE